MNSKHYLKSRYYIEPNGFSSWFLRKEGSNTIIKKEKKRSRLVTYAEMHCPDDEFELRICDANGLLEDIIPVKRCVEISA